MSLFISCSSNDLGDLLCSELATDDKESVDFPPPSEMMMTNITRIFASTYRKINQKVKNQYLPNL